MLYKMEDDSIIVLSFCVFPGMIHCGERTASRMGDACDLIPKCLFSFTFCDEGSFHHPCLAVLFLSSSSVLGSRNELQKAAAGGTGYCPFPLFFSFSDVRFAGKMC